MKKSTIYQNRLACKKAVELYLNGNIADAKQAAKRVSWSFLYCWLVKELNEDCSVVAFADFDLFHCANKIKGKIEV